MLASQIVCGRAYARSPECPRRGSAGHNLGRSFGLQFHSHDILLIRCSDQMLSLMTCSNPHMTKPLRIITGFKWLPDSACLAQSCALIWRAKRLEPTDDISDLPFHILTSWAFLASIT